MIGNQGGFSLFQMMEDINRRLDEQEQTLKEQRQTLDEQRWNEISYRAIELVNLSPQAHKFKADRQKRNAHVHGANIKLDLEVVHWLQNNNERKLVAAKQGFQVIYDLSFDEASSLIPTAPTEIIQFINRRSNLDLLHYYNSCNTQEITDMKKICTDAFDLWKESHRHGTAYPKDEIQAKRSEYDTLESKWESRKSGGNKGRKSRGNNREVRTSK
ncbi:hypothetical protein TSTA_083000 [Paecilomyces variotii No. 5]|uniref:Uncharacterized protein n=1 Tax=Byssochlamys spectabilis (strain No. 5 / NBRC 109023) TaxID=1356009 RepID=V5HU93_BYSSN|nr:hypothetical protein TSTA_083000 [Paecilomyces variotii No. 5]